MLYQFFIPHKTDKLYVMSWVNDTAKGNVIICPSVVERSLAGIRYYTSQLAMELYKKGYSVFIVNYPHTGNSGLGSEQLNFEKMYQSVETLINFLKADFDLEVDTIIGVGGGNYIATRLANAFHIKQVVLMNPDFKAADRMLKLIREGCETQATCILDGFCATNYYSNVENGSDASFTVMNMENPDDELRFWDSLCGPFFGGEEESVSLELIKDIGRENFFNDLMQHKHVTILFWGKRNDMDEYNIVEKMMFCGEYTNENYWYFSSVLFDKTIAEALDAVCCYERVPKSYSKKWVLSNLTINETLYGKKECISIDYNGMQCLGMLHSPKEPSDKSYPLVIFEHGLACDSIGEFGAWAKLSEKLAQIGFYSYRYDHVGSGVSEGDFEDTLYSDYIGQMINNIQNLQIREELNKRPVVIVSWSFGAYVSLISAEQLKHVVSSYVFWSPLLQEGSATTKVKFFRSDKGGYRFPISPLWLKVEYLKQEKQYHYESLYNNLDKPLLLITGDMDNRDYYRIIEQDILNRKDPMRKHVMVNYTGHCFSKETIDYVIHCTISWLNKLYGHLGT